MPTEIRRVRRRRRRILGIKVPRRGSSRRPDPYDSPSGGPDDPSAPGPVGRVVERLRRHPRLLAALALVVLVPTVWLGLLVKGMVDDLRQAERQAEVARLALTRGDAAGAERAIGSFREATASARDRADGVLWRTLGHLPLVGDDVEVVRTTSDVLAALGDDGLSPLLRVAGAVQAGTFQPVGGRFPVEQVGTLVTPLRESEDAFGAASRRLDGLSAVGLVGPVEKRFVRLRELVDRTHAVMGSLRRASELLPTVLGADGPRDYLLVLQNNAESRSSGGLPGSLTRLRAVDGRVSIASQTDMAALGVTDEPILPLTDEERDVFGPILGTIGVDATLTPDFPRAGDLVRARWRAATGGDVDGVVFVDPVVGSYLLRATGPVALASGPPVTADDVVRRVENEIYAGGDTTTQSDFQNQVARAVFDRFVTGAADPIAALTALVTGVDEGRVRVRLFSDAEQAVLTGTRIAGEFVDSRHDGPEVGFYVNDAGPTKMQYYLRRESSAAVRSCRGGAQEVVASVTLRNATPPGAERLPPGITGEFFPGNRTDPGQQLLVVYVTSPRGGTIDTVLVDGQIAAGQQLRPYAGRQVATVSVLLEPGESRSIEVRARSGPGQRGDTRVTVSPGAQAGTQDIVVPSACSSE